MTPSELVEKLGGRFSEELRINLPSLDRGALFEWLLASVLFGARISGKLAKKTWRAFERRGVLSPDAILGTGWKGIVEILDEGGYARYDFRTASKLIEVCENLEKKYGGDLNLLHAEASGPQDLEVRLMQLGKGIGPVTVQIFLREMRGIWQKADPPLSPRALNAAKALGYVPENLDDIGKAQGLLSELGEGFPELEAALVRFDLEKGNQKR